MTSEHFRIPFRPLADPAATVTAPGVRFTVLTPRLVRLEQSATNTFEDHPTQTVWYREQPVPAFTLEQDDERIIIETDALKLVYVVNEAGFSPETLSITVKATEHEWYYGDDDPENLLGTIRTLDKTHDKVQLGTGLISRAGWSVLDDSYTLVFNDEGWVMPRSTEGEDLYFFGYGHDYYACLRDYSAIAGKVPLLPRWSLGNWWSRYWAYSQDELLDLMQRFREEDVPLSVCIVDMDWHITDTGNASTGWTGFTWNDDLFPDPEGFIRRLHRLGLKTALNLHPADGIYPHEAMYEAFARHMDVEPDAVDHIPLDIHHPHFTDGYFKLLIHPKEEIGVDFWWMDWQQGVYTAMPGLDPLWWLNHLHYYDMHRDGGTRPFIFSRWGGISNHRYPIGFSGDTYTTWEALAFQPYMTATAANVQYGWWSHDIGGHFEGIQEPELYARWVQYGVFSPIMRLHSSNGPYEERHPWGYNAEVLRVSREAMQLRHALIPYLYTMAWQNHIEDVPPLRPMYYDYPEIDEAYHAHNEYTFGSELIAAPHVFKAHPETDLSRQVVWLPEGDWFDFFNDDHYVGGTWHALYGTLEDIPLFAKAGAIVPLGSRVGWGGVDLPGTLDIHIFPGADNTFTLYEDDGESNAFENDAYALTPFSLKWLNDALVFEIGLVQGDAEQTVSSRDYDLTFHSIGNPGHIDVQVNGTGRSVEFEYDRDRQRLHMKHITLTPFETLTVKLSTEEPKLMLKRDRRPALIDKMLRAFRMDVAVKDRIFKRLPEILEDLQVLGEDIVYVRDAHMRALVEVIAEAGIDEISNADFNHKLVMWNTHNDPAFSYRWSRLKMRYNFDSHGGTVPQSQVIVLEDEREHIFNGDIVRWKVRFDYAGLTTKSYTNVEW